MTIHNHFFPEAWQTAFHRRMREIIALTLISISILIFISLISYSAFDHSLNTAGQINNIHNFFGQQGAYLADALLQYLGNGSYIIGPVIFIWGLNYFSANFSNLKPGQLIYLIIATLCASAIVFSSFALMNFEPIHTGVLINVIYKFFANFILFFINEKIILMVILMLSSLIFIVSMIRALNFSLQKIGNWLAYLRSILKPNVRSVSVDNNRIEPQVNYETYDNIRDTEPSIEPLTPVDDYKKPNFLSSIKKVDRHIVHSDSTVTSSYKLPAIDLLDKPVKHDLQNTVSQRDMDDNAVRLIQVLLDFGVKGKIVRARSGPVVTLYEFEPASGIKSSRIIGLSDDIARSMSALSARIALIPGKTEIGIELPNPKRLMVNLYSLLKHSDFNNVPASLCLALGQNISGEPVYVDLCRMPHMIVAGTTGSGKSVGINTMILSLLYRHTPATCRFIMIDPKMLELSVYNDIPHLLTPVVTDPKKAVSALKWTVKEMENRYRAMSHLSVRNIEGYNQRIMAAKNKNEVINRQVQTGFNPETGHPIFEEHAIDMTPLPYIVVIVDEMADLMMVAGKDIEVAVQRLAQMARAAGIHVIMATQRPSVDVITGTIKANFPTRISFQVTSKFDSKTILGEQGAEQLLGRGDMLLMEAGGKIQRVHGPFVSDQEVETVVLACKQQGRPDYVENITQECDDFGMAGFGNPDSPQDDLYQRAIEIVRSDKKASTSYIQRKLEIGYNKAATIIERMEADGIVSSANHVGKRQVLI